MAVSGGFTRWWRWSGAAEGLAVSLVVLVLVGVVSYAASVPTVRVRWDLTAGEQFTLSDQTRAALATLAEPVRIYSVMYPEPVELTGLDLVQHRAAAQIEVLLTEYALASGGGLEVHRLHPYLDSLEVEALHGRHRLTRYNVVIVEGPERTRRLDLEDLVTIDRGVPDPAAPVAASIRAWHAEGPLTSAILSVTGGEAPRVGFVTGFGGPRPDALDGFDLGLFFDAVRGQGVDAFELGLSERGAIPDDVDVVVLCGPELPLSSQAREKLVAFHRRGGGLLLAIDPDYDSPECDELVREIGLLRERAVLCLDHDPFVVGLDRVLLTIDAFDAQHVVTAPIAAQRTFARFFATGSLARSPAAPAGALTTPLATTAPRVFGDFFLPGAPQGNLVLDAEQGEVRGARHVAWAVEGGGEGRAVVLACASPLTNSFLTSRDGGPANMDLGLNAVNWLVDRPELVATRPRAVYESRVDLVEGELATIHLYVLVLMPLGGVAMGLAVWFTRRR